MADCKCDLGNILDEETFNVRVIRELCNISNSMGTTELLRMVDQTDGGDVQFIRTSNGDFELDGETSYTPIGEVKPYKRDDAPHIVLPYCYLNESPVPTDITVNPNWSKFSLSVSIDQDCFVYGARTSSSATDKLEIRAVTSAVRFNTTIGSNSAAYSYVTDLSSRTDMENDGTDITTINSGTTNTVSVGSTPGFVSCPYPVCIGGMQTGSSITATLRMKGYFWKNEIEVNNVLAHQIIPVKMKSDNTICLYDTITNKYYYPIEGTQLLPERPLGLMMVNPGSLQMNLNGDDELDVEPTDEEEEEK